MKRNKDKNIEITLDMNKDYVEVGKDSLHITTDSGIRIELPYERAEIESCDRIIGLKGQDEEVLDKKTINRNFLEREY